MTRRHILRMSWPLILASASDVIMTTVDMAFVGRIGTVEIAAVGLSGLFVWATYNLVKGVLFCVGTTVSQHFGAGNSRQTIISLYNGLCVAFCAATLFFLFRYIVPFAVELMGPSQAVQEATTSYLQIRYLGALGFLSSIVFAAFFRGVDQARYVLRATVTANALNIVLDYIFIFVLHYGISGAAAATAISQLVCMGIYAVLFYRMNIGGQEEISKAWKIDWISMRFLFRIGTPYTLKMFSEVFVHFLFVMMVGWLGDSQLAATTIMIQLLTLTNMTANGIGQSAQVLVGQAIGAGDNPMAMRSGRRAMEVNLMCTALFSIALVLLAKPICQIFNQDVAVIAMFVAIVPFGIVEFCCDGLQMVAGRALSGAGDTKILFKYMMFMGYGFFIPACYLFTFVLGWGLKGAWFAAALFIFVTSILYMRRFWSGIWQRHGIRIGSANA